MALYLQGVLPLVLAHGPLELRARAQLQLAEMALGAAATTSDLLHTSTTTSSSSSDPSGVYGGSSNGQREVPRGYASMPGAAGSCYCMAARMLEGAMDAYEQMEDFRWVH